MGRYQYIAFYKPYGVLSQFTKEIPSHNTLADYLDVSNDIYPIGRLDRDSEGLLLLANDTTLNDALLHPRNKKNKSYYAQLDGAITQEAISLLMEGVKIKVDKSYHQTLPCTVQEVSAPGLPDRDPPIRYRKSIPTSWVSITISEGKNRQVRKMCATVGYPVLRLVRYKIGKYQLGTLQPGEWVYIDKPDIL